MQPNGAKESYTPAPICTTSPCRTDGKAWTTAITRW